jgi:hypothetical protein
VQKPGSVGHATHDCSKMLRQLLSVKGKRDRDVAQIEHSEFRIEIHGTILGPSATIEQAFQTVLAS